MHPETLLFFILTACLLLAGTTMADPLPDLPEAFEAGWKGEKTCQLIYETKSVRVARCNFAPGSGHEKHFHYPHFGWALEGGLMRITDENGESRDVEIPTGGSWSSDVITVHEALNIGETNSSYLIVEPKLSTFESPKN